MIIKYKGWRTEFADFVVDEIEVDRFEAYQVLSDTGRETMMGVGIREDVPVILLERYSQIEILPSLKN